MNHLNHRFLVILLIAAAFVEGCVNDPVPEKEKKFELGMKTEFLSLDIGSSNVILTIDTGKHTGFGLYAMNGAYSPKQTVHISTTPITGNTFGNDVTPVTPLYTYDAGGKTATANILITIPVTIPSDKFAMGFYYDPLTHELEGLPLGGENAKGITVVLRKPGEFFISMISKSKLGGNHTSDFKLGIDDWDIVNEGTVLTPSGQFAGQSLSELWYYYKKANKENPHLRDRFNSTLDNPPAIWFDNVEGILFASKTELDYQWAKNAKYIIDGVYSGATETTQNLIAYSILVTKKPQCVVLMNDKAATLPVVVYRIDLQAIFFSDPNFPTSAKQWMSLTGSSKYFTALSLPDFYIKSKNLQFDNCTYIGANAILDFDKISASADSAASQAQSPQYASTVAVTTPGFTLENINGSAYTLADSINVSSISSDQLIVFYKGKQITNPNGMYPLSNGENVFGFCTKTTGVGSDTSVWKAWSWYKITHQSFVLLLPLVDGGYIGDELTFVAKTPNPIGSNLQYEWDAGDGRGIIKTSSDTFKVSYDKVGTFSVKVTVTDIKTGAKNTSDIISAHVRLYPFSIFAANTMANGSQPTSLFIQSKHTALLHLRYEWDFGDGSGTQSFVDSNRITHPYKLSGKFTAKLRTFVVSTGQLFGSADTIINIQNPVSVNLSNLKSMKFVKVGFSGLLTKHRIRGWGDPGINETEHSTITIVEGSSSDTASNRIIWNGNNFNASESYANSSYDQYGTGGSSNYSKSINGEISSDGAQLLRIASGWSYGQSHAQKGPGQNSHSEENQGSALGFTSISPIYETQDSIAFFMDGPMLEYLATQISDYSDYFYQATTGGGPNVHSSRYVYTDWLSSTEPPRLIVIFYK